MHKARRNKWKNKVRSHEQQQLGDGGKKYKEWKEKEEKFTKNRQQVFGTMRFALTHLTQVLLSSWA